MAGRCAWRPEGGFGAAVAGLGSRADAVLRSAAAFREARAEIAAQITQPRAFGARGDPNFGT